MTSSSDTTTPDKTTQADQTNMTSCQEPASESSHGMIGFDRTSDFLRLYSVSGDLSLGMDTLTFPGPHGNIISIHGLHAHIIEDRSPLLAAAFERFKSGQRLHLETLSEQTATPFVRFLYTGSYAESGDWEDVPTSLLLHCKMSLLGDIYDMPDLTSQAYVNILRQCEFGCSSPDKPIDLCNAISFIYGNLSNHSQIADAVVHYCVSCFLSHGLGKDAEFKELAYHLRAFHQDLTKACKNRDYADESAAAIIQMPYKRYTPETYASLENPAIARFEDLIHHYHSNDKFDVDVSPKKRQRVTFDEKSGLPTKILKKAESNDQTEKHLPLRFQPVQEFTANSEEKHLPLRSLPVQEPNANSGEKPTTRTPISLPIRKPSSKDLIAQLPHIPIWKRRPMKDFHDATLDGRFAQFAQDLQATFDPTPQDQQEQEASLPLKQENTSDDFDAQLQQALQASIATGSAGQDSTAEASSSGKVKLEPADNKLDWDWEDWGPDPVRAATEMSMRKSLDSPGKSATAAAAAAAGENATPKTESNTTNRADDGNMSDPDESSWVNVPLDSSSPTSQHAKATTAAASKAKQARGAFASASSDSEWDFCS